MGSGSLVQMAVFGLFAILAITMGAMAQDAAFAIHMFIFAAAAGLCGVALGSGVWRPARRRVAAESSA